MEPIPLREKRTELAETIRERIKNKAQDERDNATIAAFTAEFPGLQEVILAAYAKAQEDLTFPFILTLPETVSKTENTVRKIQQFLHTYELFGFFYVRFPGGSYVWQGEYPSCQELADPRILVSHRPYDMSANRAAEMTGLKTVYVREIDDKKKKKKRWFCVW